MLIYKITNNINGKIYIGQDSLDRYSINEYAGSGTIIKRSIKKYGIENFTKEILEKVPEGIEGFEREDYWVEKLDARNPKIGYNIAKPSKDFFTGCHHTDETKKKISENGKLLKHTEESKKRISESQKGKKHWTYNKKFSEIHRQNLSKSHIGKLGARKRIYQYNLDGSLVNIHDSIIDICDKYNYSFIGIRRCCQLNNKTSGGFIWSYKKLEYNDIVGILQKPENIRKGIPLSNEIKKKISDTHRGKKLSIDHIKKLIELHKGRKLSDETKKKMSDAHKGCNVINKKKIIQYDKTGNFIQEFDSISKASVVLNVRRSTIINSCKTGNLYKGYIWKYKDINNAI